MFGKSVYASSKIELTDFAGNKFYLDNTPTSYEITDESGLFIEASLKSPFPYNDVIGNDLFYLGPGNYFYKNNDGNYVDIITNQIVPYDTLENVAYRLNPKNTIKTADSIVPSSYELERADYFRNLMYFSYNYLGNCGLISLSTLLGNYAKIKFYGNNVLL